MQEKEIYNKKLVAILAKVRLHQALQDKKEATNLTLVEEAILSALEQEDEDVVEILSRV